MGVFDDVFSKAKEVADVAGKKSEEIVEFSKLKLNSMGINNDINKAYQRLGVVVYDIKKNNVDGEDIIRACMEEIDMLKVQLDEITLKMNEMRNIKKCSHCSFANATDAVYCAKCGTKLADIK